MKKLLKCVLACIVGISLVASCLIAGAVDSKPTLVLTRTAKAVAPGDEVTLTLSGTNFSTVAAVDIKIEAGDKSSDIITVTKTDYNADSYKIDGNTIHFVDLVEGDTFLANVTFKVKDEAPLGNYSLNVTAQFASDDEKFITDNQISSSELNVCKSTVEDKTVDETEETKLESYKFSDTVDPAKYFIPYGSVYTEKGEEKIYAEKNKDGSFNLTNKNGSSVKYNYFKLPDDKGYTTFGASKPNEGESPAVQFGTYATNFSSTDNYGTLVIVGDYEKFAAPYKQIGKTDEDIIKKLYNLYSTIIGKEDGSTLDVTGKGNLVRVYKVKRTKYMWKNEDGTICQYAVRVYGDYVQGKIGTGVAYHYNDQGYTLSTQISSINLGA